MFTWKKNFLKKGENPHLKISMYMWIWHYTNCQSVVSQHSVSDQAISEFCDPGLAISL